MPALSLLYVVAKLAERKVDREGAGALVGNEVSVALEELFDELHRLWREKGVALCSDFHLVLDQLDLLEAVGYLRKHVDESKRVERVVLAIETLSKLDEIIPEYVKKNLPIV